MAAKKNYKELLKKGIPEVIFYRHTPFTTIEVKFTGNDEAITYDKKDIYDSSGTIKQIDISKNYIPIF